MLRMSWWHSWIRLKPVWANCPLYRFTLWSGFQIPNHWNKHVLGWLDYYWFTSYMWNFWLGHVIFQWWPHLFSQPNYWIMKTWFTADFFFFVIEVWNLLTSVICVSCDQQCKEIKAIERVLIINDKYNVVMDMDYQGLLSLTFSITSKYNFRREGQVGQVGQEDHLGAQVAHQIWVQSNPVVRSNSIGRTSWKAPKTTKTQFRIYI